MKTDSAVTRLDAPPSHAHPAAAPVAFTGNLKAFVFALFFAFGVITS